jgi:hypothetical protein
VSAAVELVPFLAPARIEAAASRLLAEAASTLGARLEPPIPVDALVEHHLGITLEIDDLARTLGRPGVLGATWPGAPGRIALDRSLHPESGRFFFTLAHEVAHWVLHCGPTSRVCADEAVEAARSRAEVQADHFAAALLMPASFVRETVASVRGEGYALAGDEFVDLVRDVGCFTNVSRQALAIRLHTLGLVPARPRAAFDPR